MLWNSNRNQNQEQSTRKSSRMNKDETARKDVMWTKVSVHCKISWVQNNRDGAEKLKPKWLQTEFISHCSLGVCRGARTLASQGVVTRPFVIIITGWTHSNWTVAAWTVKCGFKDIFKGGKGAFCTTYTWLTVLRGPRKDSYVQNCLRSVYNKDEQSCLHSFLRSSRSYFLRISGEPTYKLWKIWTKSSSFQLCRKDSRWVCLILSNGWCFRAVSRLPWNISSPYKYFLNQLNFLLFRECA